MPEDTLAELTATELLRGFRRRELSPVEATRAALERIERYDPKLNAYCLVDPEAALAEAREAEDRWRRGEPRGLVDGVPVAIKDILLTRGWPTRRGSLAVDAAQRWDEDAPCVARLREHGAVLLGKTTTPEYGWKAVTDSPLTGITRNPWDPHTTPGGSSGGSAVAAATGMGALAVGTDAGGSIRIPGAFTGVFGFKPSFGRVPAAPPSPFGDLAHVGPMTRSVTDAALMLTVMAEPDSRDWQALPYDARDYRVGLEDGLRGLRVAFSPDLGYAAVAPEVAQRVEQAVGVLEALGAHVERADPGFESPHEVFLAYWYAGAARLVQGFSQAQRAQLDPGLAELAERGARLELLDFLQAASRRAALGQLMGRFHQRYDLLVTPMLPCVAFAAGQNLPDPARQARWPDWTPFSYPFNLTGQPAASVPCGITPASLPVGLQMVGPRHRDARVLRACRAFESACPFLRPDLSRLDG